jgi:hypothetical protein
MNMITPINATDGTVGARKVDTTRGTNRGELSTQWATRPDDQRFLSLDALYESCALRRDHAVETVIPAGKMIFRGTEEEPDKLVAMCPNGDIFNPTHFSFGQICQLAHMGGKTADVFRSMPSWLAGLNLTYGLSRNVRDEPIKIYGDSDERMLRAATGKDYGRIFDADLVATVQRFAGNGTGDTRWKVPGVMDWSTSTYNPYVDVSTETTTLFASDRDVFLFLCDDTHPIDIGTLPNGDPDLIFRGFYAWNSEVGTRSMGIATFWLRAVCGNRNLWGCENFDQLRIIHSKNGNDRFVREAAPTLRRYADSEPTKLLAGITAAKGAKVAADDEERIKFLTADSLGFSLKQAQRIVETCEREEHRKPETVWDMVQGITAVARTLPNQDKRLEVEKTAARLMDRASRHAMA